MRIRNKLISIILPMVVLLLSGACSIRYFVPVEGVVSENRYAIIRSDSLMIVLRPQSYDGNYSELNSRFFPIFIRIKNNGTSRLKLDNNNFSILVNKLQYDPIPLDYLLDNLRTSLMLKSFTDPFSTESQTTQMLNRNKEQELYYEVLNKAFSYGDLLPGGIKEGYLFYTRDIQAAQSFTIDVLGTEVGFVKR